MGALRGEDDLRGGAPFAEERALRRLATLGADGAALDELFRVVAEQVAESLRVPFVSVVRYDDDGTAVELAGFSQGRAFFGVGARRPLDGASVVAQVLGSGRPARIDDHRGLSGEIAETYRRAGVRSSVGSPIVVSARLWGVMVVACLEPGVLPGGMEARLEAFAELVATGIRNSEARSELRRLADEQAALRRVATLVARGVGAEPVFQAVADEARALLHCEIAAMVRFEADGAVTIMGAHNTFQPPGIRLVPDPSYLIASVRATGRAARFDTDDPMAPGMPEAVRAEGIRAALASPIVVDGELWGTMTVGTTRDDALPPEAEARLAQLAELMAMAVADTEARARADRLGEEQAALRRVATLVAKEAQPQEVFSSVAEEVGRVLGDVETSLWRDEGDGTATVVAVHGDLAEVGTRLATDGDGVVATVLREGRPCWMADNSKVGGAIVEAGRQLGITSAIGCPIRVGGRVWGALGAAHRRRERFAAGTERELEQFAELVATAIANAQARAELERLAEEQAALRRVATLVARGASPATVFDAVAAEMGALLQADGGVTMCRYEDDELTIVAHRGAREPQLQPGRRIRYDDVHSVAAIVRRTAQPARVDSYGETRGSIGELIERLRFRSGVGVPIFVDGRVWGVTVANWMSERPPPPETEQRMAQFGELLDTAIANADGRDQLTASRARLLTSGDEVRRRVVRDLHDGAQQRLVHGIVSLKLARRELTDEHQELKWWVEDALEQIERGNAELRELAHGILPAVLTHRGLRAAITSLVARLELPVRVEVPDERFPAEVEASAYFTISEALTNVLKYAGASHAEVTASATASTLRIEVRDDGIGGADPRGNGLTGLQDRAAALGGSLTIDSPAGAGTVLAVTLPREPG